MIESAPISENQMSYEEAVLYCAFCTHKGYHDWRMPDYNERQWGCWYVEDHEMRGRQWITPVRNI